VALGRAGRQESQRAAEYDVRVRWYDLEASWVEWRLRLLDEGHWQEQYAAHAEDDAREAAALGHTPPSVSWIVEQYRQAVFLPKPPEPGAEGLLSVHTLIAWGSSQQLLHPDSGQLTLQAFSLVLGDLCEGAQFASPAARRAKPAAAAAVPAAPAAAVSKKRAAAAPKQARWEGADAEPAAAAARVAAAGASCLQVTGAHDSSALTPKRRRRSARAPTSAPSAAGGDIICAASAAQCASCKSLRAQLMEQAADLEAIRRMMCAVAERASMQAMARSHQ
jgi:hypothetical protein